MPIYIPVKKHWLKMYTGYNKPYWTSVLKVPIKKIKVDKSLFSYQNEVFQSDVLYMPMNFDRDAWMPITINKNYYLLNGQHRLALAEKMGMLFIHAIVQDTELLEGVSQKTSNKKKKSFKRNTEHNAKLTKLKAELIRLEKRLGLMGSGRYD